MITNPDHSRWRAVVNRGAEHVLPSSGVRCQRGGQATPRVAAHHLTEAESYSKNGVRRQTLCSDRERRDLR